MEQAIRVHIENSIEEWRQWKDSLDIELFPEWIRSAEHRIHYFERALDMLDNQFSQDDNADDPHQKERWVQPFMKIMAIAYGFIPMYENGERL
jgi:hypothetical protein